MRNWQRIDSRSAGDRDFHGGLRPEYAEQARKLTARGFRLEDLADFFGVARLAADAISCASCSVPPAASRDRSLEMLNHVGELAIRDRSESIGLAHLEHAAAVAD